jgi:ATP-dependent RNA circularization protein (DNA/RNA ligase family)
MQIKEIKMENNLNEVFSSLTQMQGTFMEVVFKGVSFNIPYDEFKKKVKEMNMNCLDNFSLSETVYCSEDGDVCWFETEKLENVIKEHLTEGEVFITVGGGGYDLAEPYKSKVVPGEIIGIDVECFDIPKKNNKKEINEAIKRLKAMQN